MNLILIILIVVLLLVGILGYSRFGHRGRIGIGGILMAWCSSIWHSVRQIVRLGEMRRWLDRAGIPVKDLHAVRVLKGRVTFSATFEQTVDTDRFVQAFGDLD
jgi:hypothetical protein